MFKKMNVVLASLLVLASVTSSADLKGKLAERSDNAATALQELTRAPDKRIPQSLLDEAACVMVIPAEKKIGYVFGVKYGRGLVSCHTQSGWSAPSYMVIAGPSFGWQVGLKSTDVVLVFTRTNSINAVSQGNLTLGVAADLTVGPFGRDLQAGTDFRLSAIVAYSHSLGAFAGATLEGAVVQPDESANAEIYGRAATSKAILLSSGANSPLEVQSFVKSLNSVVP